MKTLSHDLLVRLTQIDYDRHIALVALTETNGRQRMIGVARAITDPDVKAAEFTVAVGDQWQKRGVGRILLEKCQRVGKEHGIRTFHGHVTSENTQMLNLGRELGFTVSRGDRANEYRLSMDIQTLDP
jgi:acetyltransferase